MLLPDCGIQQNSASKSDLHLGNDIFAFKYYARVGILWQKSAQHWQFTPTMGRTVDVNRHHMLVEQWTAHSQHRTAPPLVNVSLPCQLRDPTPQELWHKKWERGGDRVRFCSDSSSALKLGAEIKSVVQTLPPPNQFNSLDVEGSCTSLYFIHLSLLELIPFYRNIETRVERALFGGEAESRFHGNSLQRISMRAAMQVLHIANAEL